MKWNLVNENFKKNYCFNLLKARGVENPELFLNPTVDCLESPKLLANIDVGAQLLHNTIQNTSNKILVVADSDCDGFTSATIIFNYIQDVSPLTHIDYLLHEHKQHGLEDHINKLMDSDIQYSLIILPDSSSNDYQYHESLKEINTPVLVLDHHITDTELSDNAVIINNQLSGGYKNKDLTGAGVTYQFCRYYDEKYGFNFANKYMDLAALGIIGDMGSMLNIENRYIVKNGLGNIKNVLLKTLAEKQAYSITGSSSASWNDIAKALNPVSVAFYIVPLINAVIRAGTAEEKERLFEAFLNGDEMIVSKKRGAAGTFDTRANEAARESGNIRNRQNKMLETVLAKTENKIAKYDLLTNRILFIRLEENEDFPSELNGLLAMKLSAQYKRPTIVARRCEDGINKGSMRGLNQSELRSFKEFLEKSKLFTLVAG